MTQEAPDPRYIEMATEMGAMSPCEKSRRGVVIWFVGWPPGTPDAVVDHNRPASGDCDGSEACRAACSKICIHAEQGAIFSALHLIHDDRARLRGAELLHVKVVDGAPVPGGPPSCVDCSKLILESGISGVWLWEVERGWVRRDAYTFHCETLLNLKLPTFPKDHHP